MLNKFFKEIVKKFEKKEENPFDILLYSLAAWSATTPDNILANNIRKDLNIELTEDFNEAYNTVKNIISEDPSKKQKMIEFFFKALERESFRMILVQLYLLGFKEDIVGILKEASKYKESTYIDSMSSILETELMPFHGIEAEKVRIFSLSTVMLADPLGKIMSMVKLDNYINVRYPMPFVLGSKSFRYIIDDHKVEIKLSIKVFESLEEELYKKFIRESYASIFIVTPNNTHFINYIYRVANMIREFEKKVYNFIVLFVGLKPSITLDFTKIPARIKVLIKNLADETQVEDGLSSLVKYLISTKI